MLQKVANLVFAPAGLKLHKWIRAQKVNELLQSCTFKISFHHKHDSHPWPVWTDGAPTRVLMFFPTFDKSNCQLQRPLEAIDYPFAHPQSAGTSIVDDWRWTRGDMNWRVKSLWSLFAMCCKQMQGWSLEDSLYKWEGSFRAAKSRTFVKWVFARDFRVERVEWFHFLFASSHESILGGPFSWSDFPVANYSWSL